MTAAGRAAVDAAKADGRWEAAYRGQATAEVPADLAAAIAAVPEAQAMFDVLTSVNRYALIYRTNSVKQAATRERKIAGFVEMLARGETPYPQKKRPAGAGRGLNRSGKASSAAVKLLPLPTRSADMQRISLRTIGPRATLDCGGGGSCVLLLAVAVAVDLASGDRQDRAGSDRSPRPRPPGSHSAGPREPPSSAPATT